METLPENFQPWGKLRMKETRSLILIVSSFLAFFGISDFLVNLKASLDPPTARCSRKCIHAVLAGSVNVHVKSTDSTTSHFQPYLLPGFHHSYRACPGISRSATRCEPVGVARRVKGNCLGLPVAKVSSRLGCPAQEQSRAS